VALLNTYETVTAYHSDHKGDAPVTKEHKSHRKHPYTGSGTSTLAAAPLQQGAAPLSTFKQQYKGDAAFRELLQQKKIGQQLKSSTKQDCNTLQQTRTEAAPSRKLHARKIECVRVGVGEGQLYSS